MEHEKSEHQQDKELRKIASSAKNRQDCDICRSFRKFCKIANSGSGRHCRSSPLGDMRIPRRTTARAHFVVINNGAGQFCLSSDTR